MSDDEYPTSTKDKFIEGARRKKLDAAGLNKLTGLSDVPITFVDTPNGPRNAATVTAADFATSATAAAADTSTTTTTATMSAKAAGKQPAQVPDIDEEEETEPEEDEEEEEDEEDDEDEFEPEPEPPKRGPGRPRKEGPRKVYQPTGRGRGRPKGSKNKPKGGKEKDVEKGKKVDDGVMVLIEIKRR